MNSSIITVLFGLSFLFSTHPIYSQVKSSTMINATYEKLFELKINEEVHFEDSLSILLTAFSHKRAHVDGPTKATAYLTISKNNMSENVMLSVHRTQSKSKNGDKLNLEHYDLLYWKEYFIEMKDFHYDQSIEIIVNKK